MRVKRASPSKGGRATRAADMVSLSMFLSGLKRRGEPSGPTKALITDFGQDVIRDRVEWILPSTPRTHSSYNAGMNWPDRAAAVRTV